MDGSPMLQSKNRWKCMGELPMPQQGPGLETASSETAMHLRILHLVGCLSVAILCLHRLAWCGDAAPPKAGTTQEGSDIAWRPSGPGGGGWIQSIVWDPHDKNILYVGGDVGGFYYSADAGRTYQIRNQGLHDYFLEAIAVHPADSNIILLGTESGIHRTTDRGLHWTWLRDGFPKLERYRFSAPIGAVCFDPMKPTVAYAGIGRPRWGKPGLKEAGALYRSDDTGQTWRRIDDNQLPEGVIVSDLEVQPGHSGTILAATTEGVFRSDDGGAHWQASSQGLPHRYTEELAFAPSAPQTVYVTLRCTAAAGEPWNGGVFRSDDAGKTWRNVTGTGLPRTLPSANAGGDRFHLSSNPKEIAVDPRNADVVYVGHRDWVSAGVYKTTDGGRNWAAVTRSSRREPNMDYGWITQWGPTVQCLAISPAAPDRLAFGTSGHVFATDDAAKSWGQRYSSPAKDGRLAGAGLEVTCVWRIVPDPVRAARVYYCYMDIGLAISDDNGRTFRRAVEGMKMAGNCFGVVVDPKAPNTIWAATGWWEHNEGDICRSDDDGVTWRVVGNVASGLPAARVIEMALDAASPVGQRRLIALSESNGVYETTDGGTRWHSINSDLPADIVKALRGLVLNPTDPRHIIVAGRRDLYETRNGGQNWQRLNTTPGDFQITRLVADPRRFDTLYLASRQTYDRNVGQMLKGGVFRSDDGGQTWRQVLDREYVADVAVSPARSEAIYAATKQDPYFDGAVAEGILKTDDGGQTWRRENTGLSHRNIKTLCINPHDPATLYAGSTGNSAFIGHDRPQPAKMLGKTRSEWQTGKPNKTLIYPSTFPRLDCLR